MKITVNGQSRETPSASITDFLHELNLLPTQVAVEHNQTVLFRHEFSQTRIQEGDQIEIIRVVAGG